MSGIAALAPEYRWVNDGLDLVDSYCTNPHKWMGINFDCNLFWTTDRQSLLGALSILPEYLRSAAAEQGAVDRLPRLAGPARPPDAGAQAVVRDPLRRRRVVPTDDPLATSSSPRNSPPSVAADDRFEIVAPHPLNLLCIAARGANDATDALIEQANASGQALFTRTVLDGRSVLRVSIGSRTTTRQHVLDAWDLLSTTLSELQS